jgi:hypothetical protein
MKLILAVALLTLALSLCNLSKRSNTNTNGNSRNSGEIAESSPTPSPANGPERREIDSRSASRRRTRIFAGRESQFRRKRSASVEAVPSATPENNFWWRAQRQSDQQATACLSSNREGSKSFR